MGSPHTALALTLLFPNPSAWEWQLKANDDTPGGWLATAIYAVLMTLCWREVLRRPPGKATDSGLPRVFWSWLSLGVTALGINKQLDLQTLLVGLGRMGLRNEGLLQYRGLFQAGFVCAAVVAAASIAVALRRFSRQAGPSERLVIAGVCGLIGFIAIRFAKFNHIALLSDRLKHHRPALLIELAVSVFLCFAVWRNAQVDSARTSTR